MPEPRGESDAQPSLVSAQRQDALCDEFEAAWQAGGKPRLEEFLERVTRAERPRLLHELLPLEIHYRLQLKRPPTPDEFHARFPALDRAFLTRLIAETARQGKSGSRGSTDSSQKLNLADTIAQPSDPEPVPRGPQKLPEMFGRYRIIRGLGQGAMGTVYLAHDTQLDREVALKVPQQGLLGDVEARERFFREARAAATLRHPHICPVYDVGEIAGVQYITMAYLEGRTLSSVIASKRPTKPPSVALLIRKLAQALEEAHRRGVVHRDLKPGNVMIDPRGEPVLMDFGLARKLDRDEVSLTHSGLLIGTPLYMSPEQIAGKAEAIGPASDIWSLGVVLYELLAGRTPFQGSLYQLLGDIPRVEPPSLLELRPDLSPELAIICHKMLAKKSVERQANMADVAAELGRFIKGGAAPAPAHIPVAPVSPAAAEPPPLPPPADEASVPYDPPPPHSAPPLSPQIESIVRVAPRRRRSRWPLVASLALVPPIVVVLCVVAYNSQPSTVNSVTPAIVASSDPEDTNKVVPQTPDQTSQPESAATNPGSAPDKVSAPVASPNRLALSAEAWQDVIPILDPVRDKVDLPKGGTGNNAWRKTDTRLAYTGDLRPGKVVFPLELKGLAAECELEFVQVAGKSHFSLDLPTSRGLAPLVFAETGVARVGNLHPCGRFDLKNDQRHRLLVRIVPDPLGSLVEVDLDGVRVATWSGKLEQLVSATRSEAPANSFGLTIAPEVDITFERIRARAISVQVAATEPPSQPEPHLPTPPMPAPTQVAVAAPGELPAGARLLMTFDASTFYERNGQTFARDLSGWQNDGLCRQCQLDPQGLADGALECEGGVLKLPERLLAGLPEYTLAAWVKRSTEMPGDQLWLYAECHPQGDPLLTFSLGPQADQRLFLNVFQDTGGEAWRNAAGPATKGNDWLFVAARLKQDALGEQVAILTVDGESVSAPSAPAGGKPVGYAGVGDQFHGWIDNLVLYPRALSDEELEQVRQIGVKRQTLSASPLPAQRAAPPTSVVPAGLEPKGKLTRFAGTPVTPALPEGARLAFSFESDSFYTLGGRKFIRDLSGYGNDGECDKCEFTAQGRAGGALKCERGGVKLPEALLNGLASYTFTAWIRRQPGSGPIYSEHGPDGTDLFSFKPVMDEASLPLVSASHLLRPSDPWLHTTGVDTSSKGWTFLAIRLQKGDVNRGDLAITVNDQTLQTTSQMPLGKLEGYAMLAKNWEGVLDEVTLYPRALDDRELQSLWLLGKRGTTLDDAPTPMPAGEMPFGRITKARVLVGNEAPVTDLNFDSTGTRLVTTSLDGNARLWSIPDGTLLHVLGPCGAELTDAEFSDDDKMIVTVSKEGVKTWEADSGEPRKPFIPYVSNTVGTPKPLPQVPLTAVALSPDRRWVAAGSSGGSIWISDLATGRRTHVLNLHTKRITQLVFIRTQRLVATSLDGACQVIDLSGLATGKSPKAMERYEPDAQEFCSLAVDPAGKQYLVGAKSGRLYAFEPPGKVPRVFGGHKNRIDRVAFFANGKAAVTGGMDRTVRFWDMFTGVELARLQLDSNACSHIAISPNGQWLATAATDGFGKVAAPEPSRTLDTQIRLWRVPKLKVHGD